MPYLPKQAPGGLDTDGVRRFTEEELRQISRSIADIDTLTASHTASIAKLTNNQFARVVRATSSQTIASPLTRTKIQFNTTLVDGSSIWDGTNFRFKPTVAGWYNVSCSAQLLWSSGAGSGMAILSFNGGDYLFGSRDGSGGTASFTISHGSTIMHFNGTTDFAEVMAYIDGAGTLTVFGDAAVTAFNISLLKAD